MHKRAQIQHKGVYIPRGCDQQGRQGEAARGGFAKSRPHQSITRLVFEKIISLFEPRKAP